MEATTSKVELNPVRCTACDRDMRAKSTGDVMMGVAIHIPQAAHKETDNPTPGAALSFSSMDGAAFAEVYPELGDGYQALICYVCWLRSMGVKV